MATYGMPMGTNYGGFLSDAVRVPLADAMLVPVPDEVAPASIASLSDNIPDAWRVGPHLDERPGSRPDRRERRVHRPLLRPIALALGAERVDRVGGSTYRGTAEGSGRTCSTTEFPSGRGTTRSGRLQRRREGLACALRSTEPEGICTIIAIYFEDATPVPRPRRTRR